MPRRSAYSSLCNSTKEDVAYPNALKPRDLGMMWMWQRVELWRLRQCWGQRRGSLHCSWTGSRRGPRSSRPWRSLEMPGKWQGRTWRRNLGIFPCIVSTEEARDSSTVQKHGAWDAMLLGIGTRNAKFVTSTGKTLGRVSNTGTLGCFFVKTLVVILRKGPSTFSSAFDGAPTAWHGC